MKTRVLVNVFSASFAGVLLQRGLYFFTNDVLHFTQAQNLWLALLYGIAYVGGASSSHRMTQRLGERTALLGALGALVLLHLAIAVFPTALFLSLAFVGVALFQGAIWPIFESYMSAGESPQSLGRALSRYNLAWSLSVAPALTITGPLIASGEPRSLFLVAALMNAGVWLSCRAFPEHPAHHAVGHVVDLSAGTLERYRGLLVSARFAMLESYILLFLLAPLMPEIMQSVGFSTASATRAAGLLDVARFGCFFGLFLFGGWHGKRLPLWLAIAALPCGFALVLLGQDASTVICGEVLFGFAAGFLYTAALYYAQLVQNASVDAGGAHEALIGLGYALGPGAGLIGTALAHGQGPGSAAYTHGMSSATLPLIVACSLGALWPLFGVRKLA